jgi:hypothetical protein
MNECIKSDKEGRGKKKRVLNKKRRKRGKEKLKK